MYKIIVRNSAIVVENYQYGDCIELERNFQIYDPIRHRYDTIGMYFDNENQRLYLPRGLDLWKVKQYLDNPPTYIEKYDSYDMMDGVLIKYKPRDNEQKEALRFMIGVNEYTSNEREPQLSVNLNTGKGKTYCSIATIAYLRIKSIIITGSNTLLAQWKENIKEYTNIVDKDIFWLDGSNVLNMVLNKKSKKAKEASIFLCTHSTIKSFCDNYGWDKLREIFQILGIGIKIFDEAHTFFTNMLMVDFFTNTYKTYYVTATPGRSDWMENKIYQLSIKNIPAVDLFDEENDPHTEYIAIKWNSRPTAQQVSACKNQYGLDRNKYTNYVVKQPAFYMIMRVVMDLVIKCKGRVLMYIGTNKALLQVYQWIATNYPEFLGDIGVYTSIVDKKNKLNEKEKKLLLSTTKSAGLGEHIEGLKMTIVVAEPFKSEIVTRQTLGRTRDKNTMYVELVDLGFRHIRNYYYAKLPLFEKYACGVSDVTIDQYELEKRATLLAEARKPKGNVICPLVFHDERFFEYEEEPLQRTVKPGIHFFNISM